MSAVVALKLQPKVVFMTQPEAPRKFELKGFQYSPEMPQEARRAILEALDEARRLVLAKS